MALIRPNGIIAKYAMWFKFSTTNKAKYEALVMRLKIAMELKV